MLSFKISSYFRGDKKKADAVYEKMTPLQAEDIAETVTFILTRPPHVQIAEIIVLASQQASAALVHRE